ncbi:glycoside hydrolase N-terminal domain-containing protein [Paenibacillus sp. GCM10012307]|uniref:Glycoside hydrolase family 95 protein n=1 Tax=Paenibacillus roseus TaxID=2798579 RepID=A0A934MRP6_9BACL|nr:glycoside hydrolase family 95 protein [Paenibacillus roseus]MBJ6362544.1 glycoside hydrolase family 95 protein [Paenibacillus roseus]
MRLHDLKPALKWTEALPIGNGRLGGMVYGTVEEERIDLNEDTLWSGHPTNHNNPDALAYLPEMRSYLAKGDYVNAHHTGKHMMGPYTESYLPLGKLSIRFYHGSVVHGYERSLNLETGTVDVNYKIGDVSYQRQYYASFPDQVMVAKLRCSREGLLNFTVQLGSQLRYKTEATEEGYFLKGWCPSHVDPEYLNTNNPVMYSERAASMRFEGRVAARVKGGKLRIDHDGLHVEGAEEATLLLSVATSFNGFDKHPGLEGRDEEALNASYIEKALAKSDEELLERHLADYGGLFGRVKLNLGERISPEDMPTALRITEYGASDPALVELLFQFGRYMLIASSRRGTQPANLQGIWNRHIRPPWHSGYTLNINTQMNYWLAEAGNLSECHEPLFDFISHLEVNGKQTARIHYDCEGWTAHHNSDLWAQTAPAGNYGHGDPVWAAWPMAGVWLCQNLWEHYAYGRDEDFLAQTAYPLMKGAARFVLDWLIEDEQGRLITSPSTSPEHKFRLPSGELCTVSKATTSDLALIWDLFTNCIEALDVLGGDLEFRKQLETVLDNLYPMQIGRFGQLQEWEADWDGEDLYHRHVSHLFGVFPGRQLTPEREAEFYDAARKSLELRGDEGTGWSLAWKISLWARFLDGDKAVKMVSQFLQLVTEEDLTNYERGGVYPNLFDAHPPFQADGNFGFTAGIMEMLVQSHQKAIHLLPALPSSFPAGAIAGVRVRGAFTLNLTWRDGEWTELKVVSHAGLPCRIYCTTSVSVFSEGKKWLVKPEDGNIIAFATEKGKSYVINPEKPKQV